MARKRSSARGRVARWLLGLTSNDVRHLRYLVTTAKHESDGGTCRNLKSAAERMGAGDA